MGGNVMERGLESQANVLTNKGVRGRDKPTVGFASSSWQDEQTVPRGGWQGSRQSPEEAAGSNVLGAST